MKIDCGYTENYLREKNRMTKNCGINCEDFSCEVCLNGCKKCWDEPYTEGEF